MTEPRKPLRVVYGKEREEMLARLGRDENGPIGLQGVEREAFTKSQTEVVPMADEQKSEVAVSPTGAPVLSPKIALWAAVVVAVAAAISALPQMGISLPPPVVAICYVVVAIGAALGIASPGIRK